MDALNPLVADTGSPPIPEAKAWLARYDGARGPAIDLSQAVPGHPPPQNFLARLGQAAATAEAARYGAILGDPELRAAYAADAAAFYGAPVAADEVAITAGCNLAFVIAAMLVARAGEAVLLPTPWYFNHAMTLGMLGVEARPLPALAEHGFVPRPEDAEPLLADGRVRAIVLVTPNNPTGAVYPAATIEAFAALCRRRGVRLVLDETYRDFLPDGIERPHAVLGDPDLRRGMVQLYSFSKAYGIPGHRLGAMLASRDDLAEVAKLLDCLQISPARAAQMALAPAMPEMAAWRASNRTEINARGNIFRRAMAEAPGWRIDSLGAYFAYLRHPFPGEDGRAVAERLAAERGVLMLPGSFFGPGQDGHLRVAVANVDGATLAQIGDRLRG
jgi:aspartate/methionine/tyrosine aminotransferase